MAVVFSMIAADECTGSTCGDNDGTAGLQATISTLDVHELF